MSWWRSERGDDGQRARDEDRGVGVTATAQGVLPAGAKAPAFTLPLLGGGEASIPDPAAKGLTLVAFYKSSCPTCRLAFPFLQRLHDQVARHGGRVLGVSQDGMEGAASFAKELGLTIPLAVDGESFPVSRAYDLIAVPTLYLIDRQGTIARGGAGFSKADMAEMAAGLADSVGAPRPTLWRESESIPEFKPG
jgi:peroxiredoxin